MTKLRQYIEGSFKFDKYLVGEYNGFKRYFVMVTEGRFMHAQAPNASKYAEKEMGIGVMLCVEKDDIWIAWKPGWGVDIHYPADRAPEYLMRGEPLDCFLNGSCRCDGSSLADGEHFYPAFNRGGAEAVFDLLEDWWRDPSEEDQAQ